MATLEKLQKLRPFYDINRTILVLVLVILYIQYMYTRLQYICAFGLWSSLQFCSLIERVAQLRFISIYLKYRQVNFSVRIRERLLGIGRDIRMYVRREFGSDCPYAAMIWWGRRGKKRARSGRSGTAWTGFFECFPDAVQNSDKAR